MDDEATKKKTGSLRQENPRDKLRVHRFLVEMFSILLILRHFVVPEARGNQETLLGNLRKKTWEWWAISQQTWVESQ